MIFYSGHDYLHNGQGNDLWTMKNAPADAAEAEWDETRFRSAILAARIPKGRLLGLRADGEGVLETNIFRATEEAICVDAELSGELRAELCDPHGRPLPGYGFSDCVPVCGNGSHLRLSWRGRDLEIRYTAFSLRLRWREGTLYRILC
jgi:hypothetical protein